jgi:hypothetical protein
VGTQSDVINIMRLQDRIAWQFLSRFQTDKTRQKLKAQYHQWQVYGYSHIVAGQTLLLRVLFSITQLLPGQPRERVNAIIHQVFGISPRLYRTYRDRYLQLWNPDHIHTQLLVRLFPEFMPRSVLHRYQLWITEAARSPASALNEILNHVEARNNDKHWNIHVRNIVEFTIWAGGRVEKPFHLRSHGQWLLKDFPDPKYVDPTRYAIAASLMEQLVEVFNWRTEHGLRRDYLETGYEAQCGVNPNEDLPPPLSEQAPEWAKAVPPAPEGVVIESAYARKGRTYDQVLAAHGQLDPPNPHFLKRNLIADMNFLQFV